MTTAKKALKIFAGGFVFGVGGSLTFFDKVGYFATVDGKSMQPVFNPVHEPKRDVIFLNHWAIRDYQVQRGDIVSLASPSRPDEVLIKRVIALEGDTIKTLSYKNRYVTIPEGHCWIEGDHHSVSLDSNYFGPVALGLVHARASHIIWPPHRQQRLEPRLPQDRQPIGLSPSLVEELLEEYQEVEDMNI
ncbi:mitochondrial inner membrane protease subunit 2-like [Patiria miniata]|uniref:Mitochondrial inner membrane protease subunit 2 n=1 Tax=Patiria miniata TaxID=46514 RepID=A0A914AYK2_PATMI|nr:mitochondrial inner membrane protease subunit 2-like [Patiria miniata]